MPPRTRLTLRIPSYPSTTQDEVWSGVTTVAGCDGMPACADYTTSSGAARLILAGSSIDGATFFMWARVYQSMRGPLTMMEYLTSHASGGTLVTSFRTDKGTSGQTRYASFKMDTSPSSTMVRFAPPPLIVDLATKEAEHRSVGASGIGKHGEG
ncbi:hypothetical protein R3P38DRAFT_3213033 [Favolaschia claudopus]|uniref:Uncharacterized protein n=1 Tax=Favolaschia claudopus TaxID=2862362 RepID=A0AAW0AF03_9AGAR